VCIALIKHSYLKRNIIVKKRTCATIKREKSKKLTMNLQVRHNNQPLNRDYVFLPVIDPLNDSDISQASTVDTHIPEGTL
jgi:hypothetical protein